MHTVSADQNLACNSTGEARRWRMKIISMSVRGSQLLLVILLLFQCLVGMQATELEVTESKGASLSFRRAVLVLFSACKAGQSWNVIISERGRDENPAATSY
jgi:hypothetical protein